MAIKKISEFEEVLNLNDADMILIERNGEAKSIKAINLKKYFGSGTGSNEHFVLTVSGNNTVHSDYDNTEIAYEDITGSYDWFASRDSDDLTITYNGHDYTVQDTDNPSQTYMFLMTTLGECIQIYGLTKDSSKYDFVIYLCTDNMTINTLPNVMKKHDRVGVQYGGTAFNITEDSFPVTFEAKTSAYEEPDTPSEGEDYLNSTEACVTFDSSDQCEDLGGGSGFVITKLDGLYDWCSSNMNDVTSVEFNGVVYNKIYTADPGSDYEMPFCMMTNSEADGGIVMCFGGTDFQTSGGTYEGYLMIVSDTVDLGAGLVFGKDSLIMMVGGYSPKLSFDSLPITLKISTN